MVGVPPNLAVMENPAAQKFSRAVRLLDSFTQNFSRKALSFEFIFRMAVQHHDWNLLSKFWLLITSGVPSKVSLMVKLKFLKFKTILSSIWRHDC